MKTIELNEQCTWEGATCEDGVIQGIKILGEQSKNGNRYPAAVRKAAHKFMEGVRVNLNHPSRAAKGEDRLVESRIGKLVNVREGEGGTFADLHFLTSHPMAGSLQEAAKRMPDLYGLSINGKGTVRQHKGETIVESIDSLRSVDLVADPGATKSLFESEDAPKTSMMLLGELIAALVAEGKEDIVKDAIKLKKKMGGPEGEEPEGEAVEAPAEEMPAEESWKQDYEKLKAEKSCRVMLESAKVAPDCELVESMMAMDSDKARSNFLAWHKRTRTAKSPRSAEPKVGDRVEPDWTTLLRSR